MSSNKRNPRRRASAVGLVLLVALAFGAIAASGAQALAWEHEGGSVVLSGMSETVAGTGAGFAISSTILGTPTEVKCSSATTSGSIVAGGTGTSTIGLRGCTVSQPSNCALASQPTFNANSELVQPAELFQKFTPTGTSFATLEFVGTSCSLAGVSVPVKGSFAGRELSTALTTNHTLSFNKSGSWPEVALKLSNAAATLSGEVTQHLSGNMAGHTWRARWSGGHGDWEVEGSPFTSSAPLFVNGGSVNFSFTLGGTPISFNCSETSLTQSSTLNPGGTESVNGLVFSGCKGETPSTCTPNSGVAGSLYFNSVTGTLVRANGNVYEKFTVTNPETVFTVLDFSGEKCPLAGNQYELSGSFAALEREVGKFKIAPSFEFSKAANEATGSRMTVGRGWADMYMAGSVNQTLGGLSAGIPWSAF